jgi:hypothetical protein
LHSPLFAALTASAKNKIVFYNSIIHGTRLGCSLKRFRTTARTNWHYECARVFIAGDFDRTPECSALRAAIGVGRGARGAVISDRDRAINGKVFRA